MGFKDILIGVIIAIVGTGLLFLAIGMIILNFGNPIVLAIGGILFIFALVLRVYGRNKTRG